MGRIAQGEAAEHFYDILSTAPQIYATAPLLIRAIDMALLTRQALYDCVYLALAETERCELITADDAFVRKMRPRFSFIVRLADLP